jgi:ribose transport system substrate-binding protein
MTQPGNRRSGRPRLAALLVAGVALTLTLAACGSSGDSSSSSGSTDSSGGSSSQSANLDAAKAAVTEAEKEPTTIGSAPFGKFSPKPGGSIYLISCDLSIVGCSRVNDGLKAATASLGYKYEVCNAGSTQTQLNSCFTNAVNAKPSVVINDAASQEQAGAGYAALKKAGIKHVGMFTANPQSASDAEVGLDTCTVQGKTLADAVVVGANGKPDTLFFTESSIGCDVRRTAAFKDEYAKVCPGCPVKYINFDLASMQQTMPSQVQAALVQNPNANWVVGVFDQPASIAVTKVQQAGLANKVKVAGMDGVPANLQLIRKGQVQVYDIAVSQQEDAWAAADAAARLYSGVKVPFSVPVSVYLMSPSNIDTVPSDNVWPGSKNYEAQFEQLWGKD